MTLRFPAWSKDELLQNVKTVHVDSVGFKCEPLAYPPILMIKVQGSCLRILLDFNHYYDSEDLTALATEAKNEGYSLLKYAMPKLDEGPGNLHLIALWPFYRIIRKRSGYSVVWSSTGRRNTTQLPLNLRNMGSGYLCPISIGRYKGKYSARWGDCAYCRFNIG